MDVCCSLSKNARETQRDTRKGRPYDRCGGLPITHPEPACGEGCVLGDCGNIMFLSVQGAGAADGVGVVHQCLGDLLRFFYGGMGQQLIDLQGAAVAEVVCDEISHGTKIPAVGLVQEMSPLCPVCVVAHMGET